MHIVAWYYRGFDGEPEIMMAPMAMDMEEAKSAAPPQTTTRTRSFFPETWLFQWAIAKYVTVYHCYFSYMHTFCGMFYKTIKELHVTLNEYKLKLWCNWIHFLELQTISLKKFYGLKVLPV